MEGHDMFDKVSFLNKYPLLAKATSDCQKPTSGHIYDSINKITFESGSLCLSTLDYLLKRLEKSSPHVKLKALKIIRHLVVNGHVEFRNFLRKKDGQIKEAIGFNGPPDVLRGISPYIAVRKEAMEILQLLYNPDLMKEDAEANVMKLTKREETVMTGMGSSMKTGKYVGFGNSPTVINKTMAERAVDGLVGIVDKFLRHPEIDALSLNSNVGNYKAATLFNDDPSFLTTPTTLPSMLSDIVTSTTGVAATTAALTCVAIPVIASSQRQKRSIGHRPGIAGGGWEEAGDDCNISDESSLSVSIPDRESSVQSNSLSIDSLEKGEDSSVDCKAESNLVMEVLIEPTSQFRSFHPILQIINKWSSVNWEKVLELFQQHLKNSEAILQLRILQFIEVVIYQDLVPGDVAYRLLHSLLSEINGSGFIALQSKTRKLLIILDKLCLGNQSELNPVTTEPN